MGQNRYHLTKKSRETDDGFTVFQIERINPNTGEFEVGGWIETEDNLIMDSAAWIGGNAQVYDGAVVTDQASVLGNAIVHGKGTLIAGKARVYDEAQVFNGGRVLDNACVCDNAIVNGGIMKNQDCLDGNKKKMPPIKL